MPITPHDFTFIADTVRKDCGIVLESGKEYLVESRLTALARREAIDSLETLVNRLRVNPRDELHRKVIEAMTTNETSFFRDIHPFDALRKSILPALVAARPSKTLNIWCGAASTGQEPYTIAMMLCEAIPDIAQWKLTFLATDISSEMIARSKAAKYGQLEVNRGLPAALLVKYFDKSGLEWLAKEKLRKMIDFREMNLTSAWPAMPPLDIVFLRNVLIYFDAATKQQIFSKVRRVLRPDGYLFLGGAETTMGLDDSFQRAQFEKSGCYQPKPSLAKAA